MSSEVFTTRRHSSGLRLGVMVAVGTLTAVLVGSLGSWAYARTLGWAASSLTFLGWVWTVVGRLDPVGTAAHAEREDHSRTTSDVLVLAATIASFGGVGLILLDAGSAQGGRKAAIIGLALGSVVLSWFLVHPVRAALCAPVLPGP